MNVRELLTIWKFKVDHAPLDKVEKSLDGIKERLDILAAAEVLKGIFELAEKFGEFAEQLHLASTSAGLTVEEFQKLAFSAKMSGISQDEMATSMARLSRNLYEARTGSAEAQKKFTAVGFSNEQIRGFKTGEDAMLAFADKIKATTDPIKRQALTLELMGRGAKNMVGYLAQGSAAIQGLGAEAEDLGIVLSHDQVEALVDAEHAMQKFFAVVKALGATIASYFAPSIKSAVNQFLDFYKANRQLIDLNVRQWVYDITYAMGAVWAVVKFVTQGFLDLAKAFPTLTRYASEFVFIMGGLAIAAWFAQKALYIVKGAIDVLATGFGAIKGAGEVALFPFIKILEFARWGVSQLIMRLGLLLAETFPALADAIFTFGAALAATPIGLIAAGIAALVLSGQALWTVFNGGKWEDTWIYKMYSTIKELITSIPKFLDTILDLKAGATGDFFGKIGDFFSKAGSAGPTGQALQNADYLANASQSVPGSIASPSATPGEAPGAQSYSVNIPQINVYAGGADPRTAGDSVKAGVKEHLDRVYRETKRSLSTGVAY